MMMTFNGRERQKTPKKRKVKKRKLSSLFGSKYTDTLSQRIMLNIPNLLFLQLLFAFLKKKGKTNKCKLRINRATEHPLHTFWASLNGTERKRVYHRNNGGIVAFHSYFCDVSFCLGSVWFGLGVNLANGECMHLPWGALPSYRLFNTLSLLHTILCLSFAHNSGSRVRVSLTQRTALHFIHLILPTLPSLPPRPPTRAHPLAAHHILVRSLAHSFMVRFAAVQFEHVLFCNTRLYNCAWMMLLIDKVYPI